MLDMVGHHHRKDICRTLELFQPTLEEIGMIEEYQGWEIHAPGLIHLDFLF